MRFLLTIAATAAVLSAAAQPGTTKEGFALQWDKTLTVLPDSLQNGAYKLPAWTIAVYEADASTVMGWWLEDIAGISTGITKGKPTKASGLRIASLPIASTAMANSREERKGGLSRLTIAFAINDSVAAVPADGQEAYMHELAVKYNRAAVQQQIDVYDKLLGKADDKLTDTKGDVAKSQANLTKSNSKMQQVKAKRGKIEKDNAILAGDIEGLEKRFALSNNPKDLKKLTKAREKLAKSESSLAKLMEKEADIQADIAKHQGKVETHSGKAEGHGATKEETERTLSSLKRKHDAIK